MKYMQNAVLLVIMALALSVIGFAADAHSGNFSIDDTVQVGSTQLAPGNYKAEWSGPADALKVDIVRHGKTVATTDGKIKDLGRPALYDAVTLKSVANSVKAIDEIDFNHRTEALVLSGE
jgi:hypothetical protein